MTQKCLLAALVRHICLCVLLLTSFTSEAQVRADKSLKSLHPISPLDSFQHGDADDRAHRDPDIAILADVVLAQIPVVVFNEDGAVVTDLQQSDFRVVEDGIEQRLLYCDKDRESVSLVILGDVSQSMTNKIQFVQDAAASILKPLYPQDLYQDECSLFGIENRVTQLEPFTADQANIEKRWPTLLVATKGGTALFDGIYAGVSAAKQQSKNKRRAVIVISDGGDNHSRHNIRQTRRFLEEAGVPVFAVMAGKQFELPEPYQQDPRFQKFPIPLPTSNANFIGPAEREGPRNLKALTEVTGGSVFTAQDPESLIRITRTISNAVRYQYLLSYQPQGTDNVKRKNNWHTVHLELVPNDKFKGYNVYYKQGYYRNDERTVSGLGVKK